MRTLDRYVLRELAWPFLFGVGAFVSVFVAGNLLLRLTDLILAQGLSPWEALEVLLFWLPGYLVLTFPMSMLLATLLAFGRLSGESETVAMRAGGISFPRIMAPAAAAGLLVSLLTIAFNEVVVPRSSQAAANVLTSASRHPMRNVRTDILVPEYRDGRLRSLLYAGKLYPALGKMENVTYIQYGPRRPRVYVYARRAVWKGRRWVFYGGRALYDDPRRGLWRIGEAGFEVGLRYDPLQLARREKDPDEMTWRELRDVIRHMQSQRLPTQDLLVRLHHKLSIPFASLVFVLIAAPLALRSHRSGSAWGFGLSLAIILVYYLLWHSLAVIGERGALAPVVCAWAPNIAGAALGVWLIAKLGR
jgi:lipopolysaccharide export system permease protein